MTIAARETRLGGICELESQPSVPVVGFRRSNTREEESGQNNYVEVDRQDL